jgi:hypothetical protein
MAKIKVIMRAKIFAIENKKSVSDADFEHVLALPDTLEDDAQASTLRGKPPEATLSNASVARGKAKLAPSTKRRAPSGSLTDQNFGEEVIESIEDETGFRAETVDERVAQLMMELGAKGGFGGYESEDVRDSDSELEDEVEQEEEDVSEMEIGDEDEVAGEGD